MYKYFKLITNIYFRTFYFVSLVEIINYTTTSGLVEPRPEVIFTLFGWIGFIGNIIFFPFRDLLHLSYPAFLVGSSEIFYYLACIIILLVFCFTLDNIRAIIAGYFDNLVEPKIVSKRLRAISISFIVIYIIAFGTQVLQDISQIGFSVEAFLPTITGGLSNVLLMLGIFVEIFRKVMIKQLYLQKEIESII